MKVILSGFNLDESVITQAREKGVDESHITPEPLSAAYARISRDPSPVNELRAQAVKEVKKARRSNRTIIFEMGHHSVAEHAVFNFDIIGLSRLAIEILESHRLCSYTEKSQRYITLGRDFVVPGEIRKSSLEDEFRKHMDFLAMKYEEVLSQLLDFRRSSHPDLLEKKMTRRTVEGWAKEDARYLMPLAAEGQLGLTLNARNLELVIRRFAAHPLQEIRDLGNELYQAAVRTAPSLVLFVEASPFDSSTYSELEENAGRILGDIEDDHDNESVRLVECTENADVKTAAAILVTLRGMSWTRALEAAQRLGEEDLRGLFTTACSHMELFDAALREFEHVTLTYELVVSAAAFGQLKRHRMASITHGPYDTGLGITIPPSALETGAAGIIEEAADRAAGLSDKIGREFPAAAPYALLNAHRRRVLMTFNARELYHISRLREDAHAQWDIRRTAAQISALARKKMPNTCIMLGGKDRYPEIFESVYGRLPKFVMKPPPSDAF